MTLGAEMIAAWTGAAHSHRMAMADRAAPPAWATALGDQRHCKATGGAIIAASADTGHSERQQRSENRSGEHASFPGFAVRPVGGDG